MPASMTVGVSPPVFALRLTKWHAVVWLLMALVAAAVAVRACFVYNSFAGTDKSAGQVAAVAASVLVGPLAGLVANPGAGAGRAGVFTWTVVLAIGLAVSVCPFLFVKREVMRIIYWLAWGGFVAMSAIWFGSAILSLGMALS